MSLQILERNWTNIVELVVKPLWSKKFRNSYVFLKMDYDDFESLAGEELSKAFKTYREDKSNIYTFAQNVLTNKANTEIRNKNREKRICDVLAESMSAKISEENDTTLEDVVENQNSAEDDCCIGLDEAKEAVFKTLKPKEIKIIELSLLGFNNKTIADTLRMKCSEVSQIKKRISERSTTIRALRMSGFLGGDEDEI